MKTRLSSSQERMWLLQQLDHGTNAYNIQVAFRVESRIDGPALTRALDALLTRHPVLRSVFHTDQEGVPYATEASDFSLPIVWESTDADWRTVAEPFAHIAFDLSQRPPIRAVVVACPDGGAMLCLIIHHIVVDGHSLELLERDLAALYAAECLGECALLPEGAFTYRDYVEWQRAQAISQAVDADLAYWRRELDGVTALDLPLDRPRTSNPGTEAAHVEFILPAELTASLQAMSLRWRCALSSAVAGIFQALLAVYTGQEDIALGAVLSGRQKVEFNNVVGCFVSTVVLRNRVPVSIPFRDLLRTAHRTLSAAANHQAAPFDRVVADLRPDRLPGRNPLFDVLFVYQGERKPGRGTENGLELVPWTQALTRFDLELHAEIVGECVTGTFIYRIELFDRSTIARLAKNFVRLVEQLVSRPDGTLATVDLRDETERSAMSAWNGSAVGIAPTTLTTLLERQLAHSADAEAIVFGAERLTYAELDRRTGDLAAALCARGAGPERVVAVSLPRSVNLVVAVLAVVRSGAAYLSVEPDLPEGRKAVMLADVDPVVVLDEVLFGELSARPGPSIPPSCTPDVRNPAYVICTSGSTGTPKAVVVSHGAIVNQLLWMQSQFGLRPDDRMLQKTPSSFDVSVWEFFWPFLEGATLVIAAPGGHRDPRYLAAVMREEKITTVNFVPSMLQAFLAELGPGTQDFALRRVICGGEALTTALQQRFFERFSASLFNIYGPAETIGVTGWDCVAGANSAMVPIGKPLWNSRVHVLNAALVPLPAGVTGEIYLAGDQLARGYADQPGMTATRFIADPFGPPGSRMYRSGDLARWAPDGNLHYCGRRDDQVKLLGVRVELDEISVALQVHPAVEQVAVSIYEPESGIRRIVAYIVPNIEVERGPELVAELRATAAHRLLPTMLPADYVFLDSLPVSVNGKLDRKALPAPRRTAVPENRAPRTAQEARLSELFARVLEIEHIGIDESFFELGGHSLLAARLVRIIQEELDIDLAIGAIFQAPTVAGLTELIGLGLGDGRDALDVLLPIRGEGDETPIFFVHPGVGLSWCYFGFSSHLRGMPLYGLQSRAITGLDRMAGSVSEMAGDYLDQVRKIQQTGPYRLVGWSFGGNVAHAMAGLLGEADEEVELLAVIDAYPYAGALPHERMSEAPVVPPEYLDIVRRDLASDSPEAEIDEDRVTELAQIMATNVWLAQRHEPPRHRGDLIFFQASGHVDAARLRPDAWAEFITGTVESHPMNAGHFDLLSPEPLARIASVLNAEFGSARSR